MSETMITQTESTVLSEGYAKAVKLDQQIESYLCMAVQNTIIACRYIAEMKESGLYTELGYKDFDDYIEKRHNIKSRQAYKYISIAKNIPEDLLSPGAKIGMSQLYLLSTLSKDEREKVVEETDIENVTKRELEKKVKELKLLRKDLEQSEAECDDLTKNCEQLKMDLNTAANDIGKLQKENDKLKRDVEELESRPIDVAVKDNDEELKKLREAVKAAEKEKADLDKKYKARTEELIELNKSHMAQLEKERTKLREQHKSQLEEVTAEYEKKLLEVEKTANSSTAKEADQTATFKSIYSVVYDAVGRLLGFTKEQGGENKERYAKAIEKLGTSLIESSKEIMNNGE